MTVVIVSVLVYLEESQLPYDNYCVRRRTWVHIPIPLERLLIAKGSKENSGIVLCKKERKIV